MRWGVRDDATDAHMTTELCLREIKACQDISVGPNFVVSYSLSMLRLSAVVRPNGQLRQARVARGVRGHAPPPEKF